MSRGIVGIDLGTSNTAVARIPVDGAGCHTVPILQRISATEVAERDLLPSFLYLPGAHELPEGATSLPWDEHRSYLVGEFARFQGARVPGRVVASAKSWLAHRKLDPSEPILPYDRASDLDPISPVETTSRYLLHLVESWNHQFPEDSLQNQEVILTVPASFDELARKLTAGAAAQNGLAVRLLEEPQAAFYAWLWKNKKNWQKKVEQGEHILVCDIGGGTTDFTLIRVDEELKRVAVGDHLMLGGDNLDIALAHRVEPRLGAKLDLLQWGVLRHQCRRAKEELLGPEPPQTSTITVPGSGAKLLAGALTAEITRAEVEELVLDGFFPKISYDDRKSPSTSRKGLREWGLPYESDPAVPRHLARFLQIQNSPIPSKVLFNGGACRPQAIRDRVLEILSEWRGDQVTELHNPDSHLAVARGAAWYGWQRRTDGIRIGGGSARSYYLGLAGEKALCVVPRNLEEGRRLQLQEPELKLLVGQPARFPLYSASDRPSDEAGELVELKKLVELPPLETVIEGGGKKEVPVKLSAEVTEVGTLELGCESGQDHWSLEFSLRGGAAGGASAELQSKRVRQARTLIEDTFALKPKQLSKAPARPRTLLSILETELDQSRDEWSPALLRAFWDSFHAAAKRRRVEPEYEASWFNGVGYTLRPGFGMPLDDWRRQQMEQIFEGWMQFPKEEKVKLQWWIMWRRIAPGLSLQLQSQLWDQLHPLLLPGRKHIKTRNKGQQSPVEQKEMLRLAVSLERVDPEEKALLGEVLMESFTGSAEDFFLLARLAAREPLGGALNQVLDPELVAGWVEKMLGYQWSAGQLAGLALAKIARVTGDRRRDLPGEQIEQLAQRFKKEMFDQRITAILKGQEEEKADDQAALLGDALPVGLRLAEPVAG